MIRILQFGSRKTEMIKSCVLACGREAEVLDWKEPQEKTADIEGIIFSGSPTFFTEVDHAPYHEKISPLLQWNVPVLGICFGHQLLGILHGAKIFRGTTIERDEKITLLKEDALLKNLGSEFVMKEDHSEGIELPGNFFHLASSASFPVEGMKHKEKNFWGVQFHPEVSGENGMVLFRNFMGICNAAH